MIPACSRRVGSSTVITIRSLVAYEKSIEISRDRRSPLYFLKPCYAISTHVY
jgi:hypothetical protein